MELSLNSLCSHLCDDLCIDTFSKNYILKRLASEGIRFLTVELPKISKTLIKGLEQGFFDRIDLTSFGFKGSILHIFEELISEVFCFKTGLVLASPSHIAVRKVRQVTEYLYKLALDYRSKDEAKAKRSFVSNETDLKAIATDPGVLVFADQLRKDFETHYKSISSCTASSVFKNFRPRATNGTYVGGDSKYYFDRISTESNQRLPSTRAHEGFYKPYPAAPIKIGVSDSSDYSELLLVPKDSRGPRTICREDRVRLETQMAYFDFMISKLNHISKGAINFRDQTINRRVAESSSVTKDYCTLDLKDASDRVSWNVVKTIFRNSPGCYFFVTGDRRASYISIDHSFSKLYKLAGMGSGLTFPTMSLLISLAICNKVRRRFPGLSYDLIRSKIFIYGDDICCPSKWYSIAVNALALIGLTVNVDKSFVRSHFRESCGGDYLNGDDVTPTRLRLQNSKPEYVVATRGIKLPNSPNAFKQLYEHSKECWSNGLFRLSKFYMSILNNVHVLLFRSRMSPGKFDMTCSLFVDYTKGTTHIPYGGRASIMSVMPIKHRSSKIINDAGNLLERCPYKYLKSSFNREVADVLETIVFSSFDEVAIPRALTFVKRTVLTDFIIDAPYPLNREEIIDQLNRNRMFSNFAHLMCIISDI